MAKVHDLTRGQTKLIDWGVGDYTLHDYGRGKIEVGVIARDGRIFGVSEQDVPAFVKSRINWLYPGLYDGLQQCVVDKVLAEW